MYLFDSDLERQQAVKNATDKAQEEYNVALENARIHQEAFRNTFCLNLDVCPIADATHHLTQQQDLWKREFTHNPKVKINEMKIVIENALLPQIIDLTHE